MIRFRKNDVPSHSSWGRQCKSSPHAVAVAVGGVATDVRGHRWGWNPGLYVGVELGVIRGGGTRGHTWGWNPGLTWGWNPGSYMGVQPRVIRGGGTQGHTWGCNPGPYVGVEPGPYVGVEPGVIRGSGTRGHTWGENPGSMPPSEPRELSANVSILVHSITELRKSTKCKRVNPSSLYKGMAKID